MAKAFSGALDKLGAAAATPQAREIVAGSIAAAVNGERDRAKLRDAGFFGSIAHSG